MESAKQLAGERKKDFEFIRAKSTIELCEKYEIKTIRYDEAELELEQKDSVNCWNCFDK